MKLNQVLAIESGVKTSVNSKISALHHKSTKDALYSGLEKTYRALDDNGAMLPPESQKIQLRSSAVIAEARSTWGELFDITYAKDKANCEAKADVKVGDTVLLDAVPVTYLLFLEKQLQNILTFVSKLPVLDAAEKWTWDPNFEAYSTEPVETHRSQKISKPVVLYEATPDHPAQVKEAYEDNIVGYWKRIKYSAALSVEDRSVFESRAKELLQAVKVARAEANATTNAKREAIGVTLFGYIFN